MLPLQGIKVVDLSHAAAGPCCTMLLASMGAEVVKIESLSGDHFRYASNGVMFVNLNCNKRDMAINLKSEKGLEIALKLAAKSDVFVESFTPGTVDKLGLGYDRISQINPMIIYCSVSGFGQTGPYRQRPCYDPVAQAMSGMMLATGEAGRPPVRIAPSTIDYGTGFLAAYGVALALLDRHKNGKGQRIDTALFDTAVFYMGAQITNYFWTGQLPSRMGSASQLVPPPYQVFETKDKPVFIAVLNERAWEQFCQALGLQNLSGDPRFATYEERIRNRVELTKNLNCLLKQYASNEILEKLTAFDVPCSPLLNIDDIVSHPQVIAREMILGAEYPGRGEARIARAPIRFSTTNPGAQFHAPPLGGHTNEILKELGYSEAEISELGNSGFVLQHA